MSLRWRWAFTLALVAAVAIGAAIASSIIATRTELNDQIDRDLSARVAAGDRFENLERLPQPGLGRRGPGIPQIVDLDAIVQLIDSSGEVVFRLDPGVSTLPVTEDDLALARDGGPPILRDADLEGARHRMITAQLDERLGRFIGMTSIGAVQVAVDASGVDDAVAALTGRLIVLGLIGIALVAGTGWLLAGRAVRPIVSLTDTAETVAATERLDTALDEQAPAEIGRLATAFRSMLGSLESSRRQQQRLVSDASHEFRTPLTALKTSLETLSRQGGNLGEEDRKLLLDGAIREADQLADLSAELVALATDFKHSDEPASEVDLLEVAEVVAQRFRHRTDSEIVVTGEGTMVQGRRSQLDRAISNLLDNAAKWNAEGAPIEVEVAGSKLSVRDHGTGIAEEDLPHVFERFHRGVAARSEDGSGLGLAIVEHIVSAHGGTVFAGNHPDGGAEVGFEL